MIVHAVMAEQRTPAETNSHRRPRPLRLENSPTPISAVQIAEAIDMRRRW
jgi:hypothetical protein